MMILLATILIMLGVAWAQYRNGLFSSVAMLIAVVLSGCIAFNFWEPMADGMEPFLQGGALNGCEDMIALLLLFGISLFLLRLAMFNYLVTDMIVQHGYVQYFGGSAVGLIIGYLTAGFLICAVSTLPLDEHFLDFEPRTAVEAPWRPLIPPDRVWLALMRHAGAYALSKEEIETPGQDTLYDRYQTFDRQGTFELRYLRYRRSSEGRGPLYYQGEFDRELYGKQKSR